MGRRKRERDAAAGAVDEDAADSAGEDAAVAAEGSVPAGDANADAPKHAGKRKRRRQRKAPAGGDGESGAAAAGGDGSAVETLDLTVYVEGIPYEENEASLRELLSPCGTIVSVRMPRCVHGR